MIRVLGIYFLAVNLIAFILYGMDKKRAKQKRWRISEKTLLGIAVVGGSVGAFLGMHFFHHKTRHWYFRYGLPMIMLLQGLLAWMIFNNVSWINI